jgi:hypothetical protein
MDYENFWHCLAVEIARKLREKYEFNKKVRKENGSVLEVEIEKIIKNFVEEKIVRMYIEKTEEKKQ